MTGKKGKLGKASLSIGLIVSLLGLLSILDTYFPMKTPASYSTVILSERGYLLRAFSNEKQEWRYPISLQDVPPRYLELLLGYEDRWFYHHLGLNPFSIMRAAWQNLWAQRVVSGGSTLTMQVARLLDPHERSLAGKLKQALRALQLEWHLSKDEILQLYLNLAPFGGTLVGVQAASISYFGKPLKEITDAEAALLAVLPQAPSRWRPDRRPKQALAARNKVLLRMEQLGLWTSQRVADAMLEPIFAYEPQGKMIAPLLSRRLKKECPDCEKIETTIDIEMQLQLESLVGNYSARLPEGLSVGVLVMENETGAVKSYLGSADFLDNKRFGHVDMVQAVRSPGSTLKPFLYGLAIDQGVIHSQSLLQDVPRFKASYRPLNFSGGFNGPVSVTEALQRSLNIPAVQVLERLGPEYFAAKLQSAGLQLQGPGAIEPNISMILGGVGVKLENLVGSYAALGRGGIAIKPRLKKGDVAVERYLFSPGAAWVTWKMLAFNPKKSRSMNRLIQQWNLAWKTGTSYGYRESWAVGVSKRWTIGVWVGRPDASASPGISGRKTAAPLLFKIFRRIKTPKEAITRPDNVSEVDICWPLGTQASAASNQGVQSCPRKKTAWVIDKTVPPTMSDEGALLKTLWYDKNGDRVEPACALQIATSEKRAFWPANLEPWLPKGWRRQSQLKEVSQSCSQLQQDQRAITITSVADGATYQLAASVLRLSLQALGGHGRRQWYINGKYVGKSDENDTLQYAIDRTGRFQLTVVDNKGNVDAIYFKVH